MSNTAAVRRIDVHRHAIPVPIVKEAEKMPGWQGEIAPFYANWSVENALADMDKYGVDLSVMSVSPSLAYPGMWLAKISERCRLLRLQNEFLAGMVRDHPGRFGLFAGLPLPDIEGSLKEIEYAFDTLKADGVIMVTNLDGHYPSDPAFAPVLAELNRRKAVVFCHPQVPSVVRELVPHVNRLVLEGPMDSTRAITNIIYTGTAARFPGIRWIFCHGGGVMTSIIQRIDRAGGNKEVMQYFPNGLRAELNKMWFDILNMTNEISAPGLLKMAGVDRLLFGTDHPAVRSEVTVTGLPELGLGADAMRAIERDNALALMPNLGR